MLGDLCKSSLQAQQLDNEIGTKQIPGQQELDKSYKQNEQEICFMKFTSTKEAMSPLSSSQRARSSTNPLSHSIHKRSIDLLFLVWY
jgi:hypothetical protein